MQRLPSLLFIGLAATACATEADDASVGGSDPTTASTTSGDGGAGGTGGGSATSTTSTGSNCAQNCDAIETPPCFVATCNEETGVCELGPDEDGTACEDGKYCTVDDTCDGGVCVEGEALVCPGPADECLLVACDEAADACLGTPVENGQACTSADICSENAVCQNGACLGAPKDCSATPVPNDCNVAQCDPNQNGDCVAVPINDGLACVIGDPCEQDKTCAAGVCSGTPITGCTFCAEVEANNDIATANDDPTCVGWQAQIGIVADLDYFVAEVTVPGSRIRAQTTDLSGTGCPMTPSFDSLVRLFDALGVEIAQNNTSPINSPCSLIDLNVPASTNLPVGIYYVSVEESGNNLTSNPYVLLLDVFPPGCGDSVVQAGEECDDGNTSNGDNCDSTCQLEPNVCAETEPNGTIATADSDPSCDLWGGTISPLADHDYYEVEVTVAGSRIHAQTTSITGAGCPTNPAFDSHLRLFDAAGVELANNNNGPTNSPCSLIDLNVPASTNLPIGSYYVSVEESLNNLTSGSYLLELEVLPPGCGDSVVQAGEDCDDGNTANGDNCDSTCQFEPSVCGETEPNGTIALAEVDPTCGLWGGTISPIADKDYFEVEVTVAGSRIRAHTTGLDGTGCPVNPAFDSTLRLFNASGVELGNNNTSPINSPCSLIDLNVPASINLPIGLYYVAVEETGNNLASNTYLLHLDVYPPGCGDGIVQAGEQCDDTNVVDGDGCSSTCTLFSCSAGEVLVNVASTNVPLPIPDNMTTPSTLSVAQTGTITKVAVTLDITHAWTSDLDLSIQAPGAPAVILGNDQGGSGDNYFDTVFSSEAITPIASGTPPFTGVFVPQGGFASVLGTPANGVWTLLVTDDLGSFAGTLNAWSVVACVQP